MVRMGKKKDSYRILVERQEKEPLVIYTLKCEDNIKRIAKDIMGLLAAILSES